MTDLSTALSEIKSLPDEELRKELSSPTGYLPGYLVLGELHERSKLRLGGGSGADKPTATLASQYMGTTGYAAGGEVVALNPFVAYTEGLKNQKALAKEPQTSMGILSLPNAPVPTQPVALGDLIPMQPGIPSLASQPKGYARGGLVDPRLRQGISETANALQISPVDLATAISYETGGTFNPMQPGPHTQWGQHRGLIQFGEPQAKQYGVNWDDPIGSQLGSNGAIVKYLKASGFKPGMSGLDLYSTINAGAPGRYAASDAGNGGAPGDVADKWNNQMAGHRAKAMAMFSGEAGAMPDVAVPTGDTLDATSAVAQAGDITDSTDITGGLGDAMMAQQLMAAMAAPQAPAATPAPTQRRAPPQDPKALAEETSQTPGYYRRRRRRENAKYA